MAATHVTRISHARALREFPWLWALSRKWGGDCGPAIHARTATLDFLAQPHPGLFNVYGYYEGAGGSLLLTPEDTDRRATLADRLRFQDDLAPQQDLKYIVTEQSPGAGRDWTICIYRARSGRAMCDLVQAALDDYVPA